MTQANLSTTLNAIFTASASADGPGLAVGVAHRGRVLLRRGWGLASVEHGVTLTPRTRMRLASVTKHMTALAALLLAEDGKLDLDAPVTDVLPELPRLRGVPSLRQLLSHTGGYRCYQDLFYLGSGLAFQPKGAGLALQFAQTDANFAPGTSQLYCNGGYGLVSEAIARASGMAFEALMRDRIFAPLGMNDTEAVPSDMQIMPGMASLHVPARGGGWRRGITPMDDNRGEGSVVSTVDDMLRWLAHLRSTEKRVGNPATWKQLFTVATLGNGSVSTYALGLNRHDYRGVEVLQHGGGLFGAATQMLTVPANALDVIVMSNGAFVNPVQLGWQVVDAVLADELSGTPAELAASDRFAHLFGSRYHAASGMVFGFDDAAGKLGLSVLGAPPAPVLRDHGETLGFAFHEGGMGPIAIRVNDLAAGTDGRAPMVLPISDAGNIQRFHRLPTRPPRTGRSGARLIGRYRAPDLVADAEIVLEGGDLQIRIQAAQGRRTLVLEALSNEVFLARATDPDAPATYAMTVESGTGRAVGFRLDTGRARGLRFERVGPAVKRVKS